jgi:hypothetical protein
VVGQYQHKSAEWVSLSWRYDSGLVVSGVPDSDAALGLTAAQQTTQEDDDLNPERVKPRHVFNLGIGSDNLFPSEKHTKWTASLEIANLTNMVALYNFLSTFGGTHFLQPRTVVARFGFVF